MFRAYRATRVGLSEPRPRRANLVRDFGVFAPQARVRPRGVPAPSSPAPLAEAVSCPVPRSLSVPGRPAAPSPGPSSSGGPSSPTPSTCPRSGPLTSRLRVPRVEGPVLKNLPAVDDEEVRAAATQTAVQPEQVPVQHESVSRGVLALATDVPGQVVVLCPAHPPRWAPGVVTCVDAHVARNEAVVSNAVMHAGLPGSAIRIRSASRVATAPCTVECEKHGKERREAETHACDRSLVPPRRSIGSVLGLPGRS